MVGFRQRGESCVGARPAKELVLVAHDEIGLATIVRTLQVCVEARELVVSILDCAVAMRVRRGQRIADLAA